MRSERNEANALNEIEQLKQRLLTLLKSSAHEGQIVSHHQVSEKLSDIAAKEWNVRIEDMILGSLYFPTIREREHTVHQAYPGTYAWLLEEHSRNADEHDYEEGDGRENFILSPTDLLDWLERRAGLYWVSGKAGSGKSTLIEFVYDHPRTAQALENWADGNPLIKAAHYFWNLGSSLQKSQEGLLRTLLYTILGTYRYLIPIIFPGRWRMYNHIGHSKHEPWAQWELIDAFTILKDQTLATTRFCFSIDGLDEYDGHHDEIVRVFVDLFSVTSIKLCVSSRSLLGFQDAFRANSSLRLQDVTHNDIARYVSCRLREHPQFNMLLRRNPGRAERLIQQITDKSDGVFLWVYLTVRSLTEGFRNGDGIGDIEKRVDAISADLGTFFEQLLNKLEPSYLEQTKQIFRLVIEARNTLRLLTISYINEEPNFAFQCKPYPIDEQEDQLRCDQAMRWINSRCKGLLEVRKIE